MWQRITEGKFFSAYTRERLVITAKILLEILWCCESDPSSERIIRECFLNDCFGTAAGLG